MRILYFAQQASWPLTTGARLRNYHLARQLGAHCSVTFAGLRESSEAEPPDPPANSGFERNITLTRAKAYTPWKILRGLLGPTPVTLLNYFDRDAAASLARIVEDCQIDAVQVESVHLMPYLPRILGARRRPAVLIDWHNIESELMYRYGAMATGPARMFAVKRTAFLIEKSEDRLLASCRIHTVASERERTELLRRSPGSDVRVVPNGVDVNYYSDAAMAAERPAFPGDQGPVLLFVGSMDYHANIDAVLWFARQIWPELKRRHARAHFFVVGRNPPPEVRNLAGGDITITGTVDDVRPWYAGAAAVVVPIRTGSGTRLKILEAMAAGVPVISTRLGAEGLSVLDGLDIILADGEAEMAQGIDRVLSSEPLKRQLREAARKLVADRYDWSFPGRQLYRIHCEMLELRDAASAGSNRNKVADG
jgi:glycosyltransferase involved in cell wall biosynthesis